MPWVAVTAAVISTGLTVYGALKSAEAEKDIGAAQQEAAKQEQRNLEYNAAVQQSQAVLEEQIAAHEAGIFREGAAALKARQRTQYAKAGVTLAGSPLLVLQDTASKIQADLDAIYWGGTQRARAFRQQAGLSILQGRGMARAGEVAARAGRTRAGTALLSGAASAFGQLGGGISRYWQMTR